jgi:hypothetical protein
LELWRGSREMTFEIAHMLRFAGLEGSALLQILRPDVGGTRLRCNLPTATHDDRNHSASDVTIRFTMSDRDYILADAHPHGATFDHGVDLTSAGTRLAGDERRPGGSMGANRCKSRNGSGRDGFKIQGGRLKRAR